MKLSELRKKAESLNLKSLLDESIKETSSDFISLLNNQMDEGKNANGINPRLVNEEYKRMKLKINPKAKGRVDLKLTGAFRSKLKIRIQKYSVIVRSNDKKNSDILRIFGPKIFALNKKNTRTYIRINLMPNFRNKIKNELL